MKLCFCLLALLVLVAVGCGKKQGAKTRHQPDKKPDSYTGASPVRHMEDWFGPGQDKLVIYQLLVRLFGNKKEASVPYGTKEQNGCGTFADINEQALRSLRTLGVTHVWYTGVLEHATMSDHRSLGIPLDDSDVVKGRAGSPYSIKDYYDVAPDLACEPQKRMAEFEALVSRSHGAGLKVLIDFVPNHVARSYASSAKPAGVVDFGAQDDVTKAFAATNDFYYITEKSFTVPEGYDPLGSSIVGPLEDGRYEEVPARATGNDCFTARPSVNDWFETVKLNYGLDYENGRQRHFEPVPPLWQKMLHILLYWSEKGVDGFRCDMAEMVPVEFWQWAIAKVKASYPRSIFVAEIYNPQAYRKYIKVGGFDYLYDKVGLYDTLRKLTVSPDGDVKAISRDIQAVADVDKHMLRFLENHDEQRIASSEFAGNAFYAFPALAVTALAGKGPLLLYFGQEVGEKGEGKEGFQGDDGRTTIFDFWAVPAHQRWMSSGAFDGSSSTDEERLLRRFYEVLIKSIDDTVRKGLYRELPLRRDGLFAFKRLHKGRGILVVVNFRSMPQRYVDFGIGERRLHVQSGKSFGGCSLEQKGRNYALEIEGRAVGIFTLGRDKPVSNTIPIMDVGL